MLTFNSKAKILIKKKSSTKPFKKKAQQNLFLKKTLDNKCFYFSKQMENPIGSGKKSKKMPKDETKKIAKTKEKTK
jgi:hypothetical protein